MQDHNEDTYNTGRLKKGEENGDGVASSEILFIYILTTYAKKKFTD